MLGDFNTRVGTDSEAWPSWLGHHDIGRINENGQRLLELCCLQRLHVTNTYFSVQGIQQGLMETPMVPHCHQLDLVITRHVDQSSVLHTHSHNSADCNINHFLATSKVRLMSKKIHHSKTKGQPCFSTCCTAQSHRVQQFAHTFGESMELHL